MDLLFCGFGRFYDFSTPLVAVGGAASNIAILSPLEKVAVGVVVSR